jgi:hypothetical protein
MRLYFYKVLRLQSLIKVVPSSLLQGSAGRAPSVLGNHGKYSRCCPTRIPKSRTAHRELLQCRGRGKASMRLANFLSSCRKTSR